jgi:hypothetical protein
MADAIDPNSGDSWYPKINRQPFFNSVSHVTSRISCPLEGVSFIRLLADAGRKKNIDARAAYPGCSDCRKSMKSTFVQEEIMQNTCTLVEMVL